MGIRVPRGNRGDIPFRLYDRPGGTLIDPFGWAGGATHPEFPTVQMIDVNNVDVTAHWASSIAGDTLPAGAIKDPTPTTGVWRFSLGRYRIRVDPDGTQPFGAYTMRVTYPNSPNTAFTEDHEIDLFDPGDVEFGDLVFAILTWDDFTSIIRTSITDPALQQTIMDEIAMTVEGDLQLCGINTDQWNDVGLPKYIRALLLSYGRVLIRTYDAGAAVTGYVSSIAEGSEKVTFAGSARLLDPLDDYNKRLNGICSKFGPGRQPMMKTLVQNGGILNNDGADLGVSGLPDFTRGI